MSDLRVTNLRGRTSGSSPTLPDGVVITGVATATTFNGNATGLTGTPNITVGNVVGSSATFTDGVVITGVATASSFVGNGSGLTGISSVSFATTSFGLSGNPSIFVSNIGINTSTTTQPLQVGSGPTVVLIDGSGNLGIGTASVPTRLYVQGNAASNIVGLGTTSANTTLNFAQGNNFSLTLTGSIVLNNPTGVTTGQSGIILIQQDSSGSKTVGFGSHWDFPSATAPTLSTGANALDVLTYFVRSSTSIVTNSLIGIGTL